ncbi:MAG TPA: hypothetical protein ENI34_04295 [candidate division WOR-3 bacterium]|uniref:DUF4382 domain-containing protein n=1 Tax=candidate division WOR-3 bacterium TaxID=2052148 RepID=A0A9C9ELJ9_UNCW3|nr:hypothetical protein [candidate division WOR-3 bacterium]
MKKFLMAGIAIFIIGCGGEAFIEVGATDGALDGTLGDLVMRVLQIDIPEEGSYTTIWNTGKEITVGVLSSDFVSITDGVLSIPPGTYSNIRLTIDSLRYVSDSTVMLIDTAYTFTADAFTPILIDENDELTLVVNINSAAWFDPDSMVLIGEPFDQAALRIYYQY